MMSDYSNPADRAAEIISDATYEWFDTSAGGAARRAFGTSAIRQLRASGLEIVEVGA